MKKSILTSLLIIILSNIQAQMCPISFDDIAIHAWNASKGDLVKYIAGIVEANKVEGLIIILGKTNEGVFTIENALENDGRGGYYTSLAFTPFSGKRKEYKLCNGNDEEKFDELEKESKPKTRKKLISELKKLASKNVYADKLLKPVQYVRNKKEDNSKWSLLIKNDERVLMWTLETTSTMCWCSFDWACNVSNEKKK